jgi:ABC-type molybdate transport system ATPase subunit
MFNIFPKLSYQVILIANMGISHFIDLLHMHAHNLVTICQDAMLYNYMEVQCNLFFLIKSIEIISQHRAPVEFVIICYLIYLYAT